MDAPAQTDTATSSSKSKILGTFPAGSALLCLATSFILLRIIIPLRLIPRPGERAQPPSVLLNRIAIGTGVLGALFAGVALYALLAEPLRARASLSQRTRIELITRMVAATPVALLVLSALWGEPPDRIRWWAFYGANVTVIAALVSAIVRGRGPGQWPTQLVLGLLLFGEVIELGWPVAHVAAMPGSTLPRVFDRLGVVTELCSLFGAPLALAWSIRATMQSAGRQRVWLTVPLPALFGLMLSMLALSVRPRVAAAIASSTFGMRLDLLPQPAQVSSLGIMIYLLIPELLVCAAMVSLANAATDRGAAVRRGLGWVGVLLGGFGSVTIAGPMDPIRMVTVCMAVLLLERAVVLERESAEPAVG